MSKPVVAVVQPLTSGAMVAPAVRAAGMSPVAVIDYHGPALAPLRGGYDPQAYDAVVNYHGDVADTLEKLRGLNPSAVIPCVEASLNLAQTLADELTPDEANVSELVDARRHKYVMHQALAKAGLPIIRQICTTDPEEVAAWIEREGLTGHDLVIKPTSSAGTVGVTRAPGGEGWRDRFSELLGTYDKLGVLAEEVLVQEHMTGTEYAIDTVSHHGKHSITDIIKYRRIPYGEGIAVYDSVEWLPYDTNELGELIEYGLGALDAVGLTEWAAHTEIMMTPNGPRLLEVNARLAGAGNPAVTEIASGGEPGDAHRGQVRGPRRRDAARVHAPAERHGRLPHGPLGRHRAQRGDLRRGAQAAELPLSGAPGGHGRSRGREHGPVRHDDHGLHHPGARVERADRRRPQGHPRVGAGPHHRTGPLLIR